ncbi:MAG TPA: hypothetical protein VGA01_15550 [Candidatus Binatia bacterium]
MTLQAIEKNFRLYENLYSCFDQAQHERSMIVTANTEPIALSIVEGCVQSPRYNMLKLGIVEGWNNELMGSKPNTPLLQYSNTPFYSSASENFLSKLRLSVFSNLRRAMGTFLVSLKNTNAQCVAFLN